MPNTYTNTFLVTVTSEKPIKSLGEQIANRVWTMDGVTDVKSEVVSHVTRIEAPNVNGALIHLAERPL